MEDESIKDVMKKISDKLDKLNENKEYKTKFKIPFSARPSKVNIKKNYISVITIKENRDINFIKLPIVDGVIDVDGIPKIATTDYMLNYKGKPVIILPSWSLKPFSPIDSYEDTVKEKMTIAGRKLIADKMLRNAIENKKKGFGMIWWIVLLVALVAGGYYLFKGGKLF